MNKFVWIAIIIALIAPAIFFILLYNSLSPMLQEEIPENVVVGKRLWQSKGCVECHTLFGNGGYNAPDLTKTVEMRGKDYLEKFFAKPPMMRPHKQRKHPGLIEKEAADLIAFLAFVNEVPIIGWPPEHAKSKADNNSNGAEK